MRYNPGVSTGKKQVRSPGWKEVLILLERLEASALKQMDRGERYRVLSQSSEGQRDSLLVRLKKSGLADEVEIGRATVFSQLIARGTPKAIDCIRRSPGVVKVMPVKDELRVDLLA